MTMTNEDTQTQPTPTTDDVATQIESTHAAVLAAITAGYKDVNDSMKAAEDAVAQAVNGAAKAVQLAQQAAKKPEA
jgi:hypothetical protein